MTFDNLRNLRIIFFEKRKITLKMFEDNFENRFRSHFNHKIDSRMWNNGNGRTVTECRWKYLRNTESSEE